LGKTCFLQPNIVVRVEIVDAEDAFAPLEQRSGNVKADEPGSAGEQDPHQVLTRHDPKRIPQCRAPHPTLEFQEDQMITR